MAGPTTIGFSDYLRTLLRSQLVKREVLEHQLKLFRRAARADDPQAFGDYLQQQGLVTRWQHEKLLTGKHRGFFIGKYKLLRHISSGGMSRVFLAEHVGLQRQVALKILPTQWVDDPSYLARFHQEARAIAALDHPNIVRAYDVGQEEKVHYMAIEYIDGQDLRRYVADQGPLTPEQAADYTRQAAEGLAHAHSRGMIHRDVKPSNLLLDSGGVVRILDLGMARLIHLERSITLEHNERVLGTADYLSPEQAINSHEVDRRTDIYSLGCTLYYLLAGHVPFPKGTLAQRLMKHQAEEPEPIEAQRDDVPPELLRIQRAMVAKHPDDRLQTAAEVADVLAEYLESAESVVIRQPRSPRSSDSGSEIWQGRLSTIKLEAGDTAIGVAPDPPPAVETETVPDAKQGSWKSPRLAMPVALVLGLAMVPFLLWPASESDTEQEVPRDTFTADLEEWPAAKREAEPANEEEQPPSLSILAVDAVRFHNSRARWRYDVAPLEVFAWDEAGLQELGGSADQFDDPLVLGRSLLLDPEQTKRTCLLSLHSDQAWKYLGKNRGITPELRLDGLQATLEFPQPQRAVGMVMTQAWQPLDRLCIYGAKNQLLAELPQSEFLKLFPTERRKIFLGLIAESPIHKIEFFGTRKSNLVLHEVEFGQVCPAGQGNLIVNGGFDSPILPWRQNQTRLERGLPSHSTSGFAAQVSGRVVHDFVAEPGVTYVAEAKFCFARVDKPHARAKLEIKVGKYGRVDAKSADYNVVSDEGIEKVELGQWHTARFQFEATEPDLQVVVHFHGYNPEDADIWLDDVIIRKKPSIE